MVSKAIRIRISPMTVNFTVRLPVEDHKDLRLICFLQGDSMGEVLRKLVHDFNKENKPKVA